MRARRKRGEKREVGASSLAKNVGLSQRANELITQEQSDISSVYTREDRRKPMLVGKGLQRRLHGGGGIYAGPFSVESAREERTVWEWRGCYKASFRLFIDPRERPGMCSQDQG